MSFGIGESLAIVQLLELPRLLKSICNIVKRMRHADREIKKFWRRCLQQYRLLNAIVHNLTNLANNFESVLREQQQSFREIYREAKDLFDRLEAKLDWIGSGANWSARAKWALTKYYCSNTLQKIRDLTNDLQQHMISLDIQVRGYRQ
jgi:hypothetical protein